MFKHRLVICSIIIISFTNIVFTTWIEKITRWITNPNQRSYYFTTEDGVWPGKLYEIGVAGVMGNSIKNKTGLSRFKILGENRLEARSILTPIAIAAVTIALMYLLIVIAFQKIKTMARIQVTMPKGLDVNEAVGENVHTPRLTLEPTLDEPNPVKYVIKCKSPKLIKYI